MSDGGYKIDDQFGLYFLTFTLVGWVDIFTRPNYKDIVISNFKFYKGKGLQINAYVIMSNHIHIICSAEEGSRGLSALVRDFKKMVAKQSLSLMKTKIESRRDWFDALFKHYGKNNSRNKTYKFWTHYNHPVILFSPKVIRQKLNYIHNNPIKAKIVTEPEHYRYSSASNYAGHKKNIFKVELLELPMSDAGYIRL